MRAVYIESLYHLFHDAEHCRVIDIQTDEPLPWVKLTLAIEPDASISGTLTLRKGDRHVVEEVCVWPAPIQLSKAELRRIAKNSSMGARN